MILYYCTKTPERFAIYSVKRKSVNINFAYFSEVRTYNDNMDSTIPSVPKKKRKMDADDDEDQPAVKVVKTEATGT